MLGGELLFVGGCLVYPCCGIAVEDLRSRLRAGAESLVGCPAGGVERGVSVTVDLVGVPVVHIGGGVHPDSGVPAVVVVGFHELVRELPRLGEGAEPVGEDGQVLHRLEQRLRVGVVLGDVRAGAGLRAAEIGEQGGNGLRRHRRTIVGVHELGSVMDSERVQHHLFGEDVVLVGAHDRADDVAGEDVDHHVRVLVRALERAGEFRDVPTEDLTGAGRDQLGDLPWCLGGEPTMFPHLGVLTQHPVHRGDRAQVAALFEEDRVDLQRRPIDELITVEHSAHFGPFGSGQLVHGLRARSRLDCRGCSFRACRARPRHPVRFVACRVDTPAPASCS